MLDALNQLVGEPLMDLHYMDPLLGYAWHSMRGMLKA